jgi:hypothetical protein
VTKRLGFLSKSTNVTLNEVKGLLLRRKNEILPRQRRGQNDTMGLSNSPDFYVKN